jgi:hypothetical protein
MWTVYAMQCYSLFKKKEILSFAMTWGDLEDIMLTREIIQEKEDKH